MLESVACMKGRRDGEWLYKNTELVTFQFANFNFTYSIKINLIACRNLIFKLFYQNNTCRWRSPNFFWLAIVYVLGQLDTLVVHHSLLKKNWWHLSKSITWRGLSLRHLLTLLMHWFPLTLFTLDYCMHLAPTHIQSLTLIHAHFHQKFI